MISVVVTAYLRSQFLADAIQSLEYQTLSKNQFEVIVVHSPSISLPTTTRDLKLTSIPSDAENHGEFVSLGTRQATGTTVVLMDDDDTFVPSKLARVKAIFDSDPTPVYFHNAFLPVAIDGHTRHSLPHSNPRSTIDEHTPSWTEADIWRLERVSAGFNSSCISVEKSLLTSVDGFLRRVRRISDTLIFAAAVRSHRRIVIDSALLTLYRVYSSTSRDASDPSGGPLLDSVLDRLRQSEADARVLREMTLGSALGPPFEARLAVAELTRYALDPKVRDFRFGQTILSAARCVRAPRPSTLLGTLSLAVLRRVSPSISRRAYPGLNRLRLGRLRVLR